MSAVENHAWCIFSEDCGRLNLWLQVFLSLRRTKSNMTQRLNYFSQRVEILTQGPNLLPQRAKDNVNILPQMAKHDVNIFPCVSLSDVITNVDISDNIKTNNCACLRFYIQQFMDLFCYYKGQYSASLTFTSNYLLRHSILSHRRTAFRELMF